VVAGTQRRHRRLLARKLNQRSHRRILDPIADKTVAFVLVCDLAFQEEITWWLTIIVLSRDVLTS